MPIKGCNRSGLIIGFRLIPRCQKRARPALLRRIAGFASDANIAETNERYSGFAVPVAGFAAGDARHFRVWHKAVVLKASPVGRVWAQRGHRTASTMTTAGSAAASFTATSTRIRQQRDSRQRRGRRKAVPRTQFML
jgi:hypothetical protein